MSGRCQLTLCYRFVISRRVTQVSECTTQADAARRLGVTRHRVNNLIQMGRLRAEQLADGTPVIPLDAIDEYAQQREQRLQGRDTKPQPTAVAQPATLKKRQNLAHPERRSPRKAETMEPNR